MSILNTARARLVGIRDALDGRLHPGRRARAGERLTTLAPASVLFICLGNVCRSPYAARVLKARAGRAVAVDSAGFIGPGRPPPEWAVAVARARGIEHEDHYSKVVTPGLLASADAVFVFDRFNVARLRKVEGVRPARVFWLGDFDPEWTGKRAIIDPWGKPPEEFERTFERIERALDEVARLVAPNGRR